MVEKTYYKTKDYCKVKFAVKAEDAASVKLIGLNNDWEKAVSLAKKKDGIFSVNINLPKDSSHEFKYLVNDTEWLNEPFADGELPNIYGGTNSVVNL